MTMDLSVDGLMLATFCSYGLVKIWDVETWECIYTIKDRNVIFFLFSILIVHDSTSSLLILYSRK